MCIGGAYVLLATGPQRQDVQQRAVRRHLHSVLLVGLYLARGPLPQVLHVCQRP